MKGSVLQHIILPGDSGRPLCLYAREKAAGHAKKGELSFDTYFNAFSIKKWRRYTTLSDLWLRVACRGAFTLEIVGLDARGREQMLARRVEVFEEMRTIELAVEAPESAVLVFCRFRFEWDAGFDFQGGYFFTRAEDVRYVNIAAIFCTYNREAYLEKNVRAVRETVLQEPVLRDHFQTVIVDNGSNLDPEKYAALGARLFHNVNAGGSGGYARGMLEVLEMPGIEYALLMDDDIEIEPETLFRTVTYLSFLKKDYADYFLGGGMFSLGRKEILRVWLENYSPSTYRNVQSFYTDLDMCKRKKILLGAAVTEMENQYSGWWFCAIPLSAIRKNGLPLPFFLKMDDIELGVRNGGKLLHLNGICVWHEDFSMKSSSFNNFLWYKNSLITNFSRQVDRGTFARHMISLALHTLLTASKLEYDLLDARVLALQRARKESGEYASLEEVGRLAGELKKNAVPICDVPEQYHEAARQEASKQSTFLKKLLFAATLNGHILPPFLTARRATVRMNPNCADALFAREITVLNPDALTFTVRRRDRKRFFRQLGAFFREWSLLFLSYARLKDAYGKAHAQRTTPEFWRRYLGLEQKQGES